jgi:hypothetical protein
VQGDAESLPFNDASADAGWLVQKYKYWRSCWYKSTNTDAATPLHDASADAGWLVQKYKY